MKGFYQLLVAVAVIGGGVLWYVSQRTPSPASPVAAPGGPLPVAAADGFRGYTLGTASAPIEITEYSDFECPFCASFATVQMPVIREQLIATGKVRWRFRDYPLPSHAYSRYAALAAQCAGEQSKFWEMHDQRPRHIRCLRRQPALRRPRSGQRRGGYGAGCERHAQFLRERAPVREARHVRRL